MNYVFPMAGKGTRTNSLGNFKPFIEISNTKILHWLIKSIKHKFRKQDKTFFITTKKFYTAYDVKNEIGLIFKSEKISNPFEVIVCRQTPQGPAASVYLAKDYICNEQPVMVINCDQYIDFDHIQMTRRSGFLPVYANFNNKSSYVDIKNGKITKVTEKNNISNLASAGVYGVSTGMALIEAIEKQFEKKQTYKNEYYVGPSLNYLIQLGYAFYPTLVRTKYDLGDIAGLARFKDFLQNIR